MGLFGDKPQVELTATPQPCTAGQPLRARVRLSALDKKVQGGRLELLYRNTFQETEVDPDDGRTSVETRREDVLVDTVPLSADGSLTEGEHDYEVVVPPAAPGSSPGSVEWRLRAVVDRRRAGDATAEVPLDVRVTAQPLAAWAQNPVVCAPQCRVAFDVPSRTVRPGDVVAGTADVTPDEPITARSVRVRLRRVREDKDRTSTSEVAAEQVVAEDVELSAGQRRQVAFSLVVPHDAPPSFAAEHNRQRWYVELVVDRKRAVDHEAQLELVVHTA